MKQKRITHPACNECMGTRRPVHFVLRDVLADDSEKELLFCSATCVSEHLLNETGCVHDSYCSCFDGYDI